MVVCTYTSAVMYTFIVVRYSREKRVEVVSWPSFVREWSHRFNHQKRLHITFAQVHWHSIDTLVSSPVHGTCNYTGMIIFDSLI